MKKNVLNWMRFQCFLKFSFHLDMFWKVSGKLPPGKFQPAKFPPIRLPPGKFPPGKFPPRKFPPGIFPATFLNILTRVDFIFEASHEECDVTKFNQLNGAAWILPGELSSVLCVCEYLSKPFIRITTVKGVTTIEGIETMFCLWSFLIIFTKQPTNSGLKVQKWLD